jgi:predicted heme/steroid binding protein
MTLTRERLRELMKYDPETGLFYWAKQTSNRVKVGDVVGHQEPVQGYRLIGVDGRVYKASRLAFMWMTGEMPSTVDHANRDRMDDRWCNLRLATRSQNQCNRGVQSNSTSRLKGAHVHGQSGKWYARITVNGVTHSLGLHDTPELAHQAYREAAERLHGEFAAVK